MNNQESIDRVCKYRCLPEIKEGARCTVEGRSGVVYGGNYSANLDIKFDDSNLIRNCHPNYKMCIYNDDGTSLYESEDY